MNAQNSNKKCNPFAIINNIPRDYHSSALRNFFSQFIETKGFKCFHFRHRPEVQLHKRKENGEDENCDQQKTSSTNTCCCVVSVFEDRYEEFYKMYHRKHWLDINGESISKVCHISRVKIQNSDGKHIVEFFYVEGENTSLESMGVESVVLLQLICGFWQWSKLPLQQYQYL